MKNKVRELRRKRGWTQEILAEKSKVSRVTISQMENKNVNLSTKTMNKIAEAFGVSVKYIFFS